MDVPNVVGLKQNVARKVLKTAGLIVARVTKEYSNTVPAGRVIRQDPAAGTNVPRGAGVALVVSRGPSIRQTALTPRIRPGTHTVGAPALTSLRRYEAGTA
jgi:beta-lactam-binding protein with PASTA domain